MARIVDLPHFDPVSVSADLYRAMEGLGTNKDKIIKTLTSLSNNQRQLVKTKYEYLYNRSLIREIKNETTVNGSFRDCIFALLYKPLEYEAKILYDALNGSGAYRPAFLGLIPSHNRNFRRAIVVAETIVTRSPEDLKIIQDIYYRIFNKSLDHDIQKCSIFNDMLIRFLRELLTKKKFETTDLDDLVASSHAKRLQRSEINQELFENELIRIFSQVTFDQVRRISEEYQKKTNRLLYERISKALELNDFFRESLTIFLECANDMPRYFARRLNELLQISSSSKDQSLIKIVVSRSEIDLEIIKEKYKEMYNKLLIESISEKTAGNFQRLLRAIVGERNRPHAYTSRRTENIFRSIDTDHSRLLRPSDSVSQSGRSVNESVESRSTNVEVLSSNNSSTKINFEATDNRNSNIFSENISKYEARNEILMCLRQNSIKNISNISSHADKEILETDLSKVKITELKNKPQINEDDGVMRICSYSHVYHQEVNSMFVPKQKLIYNEVKITDIVLHSAKVVQFMFARPEGFKFKAGDYLNIHFLDHDELKNQWYSCTITSAPEETDLEFHLMPLGNLTNKVCDWLQTMAVNEIDTSTEESLEIIDEKTTKSKTLNTKKQLKDIQLRALIDGPYGTINYSSLLRIFNYEHVVLVLYGSEVKPYVSLLKSVLLRQSNSEESKLIPKWYNVPTLVKRIDFIWINRDFYLYEWFLEFLSEIEEFKNLNNEKENLIRIQVFITQNKTLKLIRKLQNADSNNEPLSVKLNPNIPNFENIFNEIKLEQKGNVHVLFSGPRELGNKIDEVCHKVNFKYSRQYL